MDKKLIKINPIKNYNAQLRPAPDKSITHRAVMFNAVASGSATVTNALLGEDCLSTIDCMSRLGAKISVSGSTVQIEGAKKLSNASLYAGNSGTTMRLLSGLICGYNGEFSISGDDSLSKRPMNRVINPLSLMGAKIESSDGKAPLNITGSSLSGINYEMPVASAQVKSAILLAGLKASGQTIVTEKEKSRDHTERMLKQLGANITVSGNKIALQASNLTATNFCVPADISSAAFALVLGAISGRATLIGVGTNPTRNGILEVLDSVGAKIKYSNAENGCEPTADITIESGNTLKPFKIGGSIMPRLIDEIPILAILACFINGKSVITDAAELKVKETDRLKAIYDLVRAFGGNIELTDGGMIISGNGRLSGGCTVDSLGDHRMAMSAAVAAALSDNGGQIINPNCADVSYPNFYKDVLGYE